MAVIVVYAALLGPAIVDTYPGDDTLLLVPKVLRDAEARPAASALAHLFEPDPILPHGLWKAYVIGTTRVLGPTHPGLVLVGVGLHLLSSLLVWALARRLSLAGGAGLGAAALHFSAYPGFHAYVWPVGVQHVLTVLFVLAVLTLYLETERRRRAGLPIRWHYAATILLAAAASSTRTTSLAAPLAIAAHAILAGGDSDQRRRAFDLWAPVVFAGGLYPLAVIVHGGDADVLGLFPVLRQFLAGLLARMPVFMGFLYTVALAALALAVTRVALTSRVLGSVVAWPSGVRRVILATVVVAAAPLVIRWTLVLASGLAALFTPLSLALNSYNTARWHMTAVPLDFPVLGLGAAAIMLFILAGRRDAVVLLSVFLVCFGTMFHGPALRPNRYWIYLTPVLAIVLAGALERLWETVDARGSRRWWRVGIVAVGGLLVLSNICAIRLEVWRHRLTDVFLALDYVRAAELIRSDLLASDIGVDRAICVTGLESPPYDASWREIVQYPRSFREHNAPVILAQAAGRRDTSRIRLDCASATSDEPGYTASASALTRNGRSVDRFASAYTRIRDLVRAGHFEQARAMAEAPGARPFCARFLLGHMRDEDVEWATNGVSVFEWADRLVANHDNWSGSPDPKVRLLKAMLESEMAGYVRLVFVREYLRARAAPPTELREVRLGVAAHRLRFRMATMTEIAVLVRSDPFLAADPAMMTFLDNLVAVSPVWRPTRDRMDFGSLRWATTLPFYDFLGRLLLSGWVGWVPGAIEDAT